MQEGGVAEGKAQPMTVTFMLEAWASRNTELAIRFLMPQESDRTRTAILNCLQEGCENGEDFRRLASRVQAITPVNRKQAVDVAHNVVGAVLSERHYLSVLSAGLTHKKWVCPARPTRELGGHRQAEQRYSRCPCPVEDLFVVNGASLRFPRDYTSGHPEECLGCQCLAIASRL